MAVMTVHTMDSKAAGNTESHTETNTATASYQLMVGFKLHKMKLMFERGEII